MDQFSSGRFCSAVFSGAPTADRPEANAGDGTIDCMLDSYSSRLFAFLYRLVGDIRAAELLAEDAFLNVLRNFDNRLPTLVALYETATQAALRYCETRSEIKTAIDARELPEISAGMEIKEDAQGEPAGRRDLKTIVARLFELPLLQRAAVLLHKYDSLDFALVGRILHLDQEVAASLVRDGYRRLCGAAPV